MNLAEREAALLKLIHDYQYGECQALLAAARTEAAKLIVAAYRRERARLHARVVAERANARARIQAARAERETRARASGDRANARLLELAWPRLRAALHARWSTRATRRLWTDRALEQARQVLPPTPWTIRHPPDWDAAERREALQHLALEPGRIVHCLADGTLTAGLVITSGAALLDASLEGLLRDRFRLEARLLALMAPPAGNQENPP